MLKNRLFMGDTPCQCTSAGACQKSMESGRYSAVETHMAVWKSGAETSSCVILPPSR